MWLISPDNKSLFFVLVLSIIILIFELLSIGIFIPIINVIQSPERLKDFNFLKEIYPNIFNYNKFELLLIFISLIFILYVIKFLFNISTSVFHAILASKIDTDLSIKLYKSIINKPYEFHSYNNSSTFISTIINEVHQFSELIKYVLILLVELFVMIGVFLVLLTYKTLLTLLLLLFGFSLFILINYVMKNRLIYWGAQRQKYQDLMYKNLKESFASIVIIKLRLIGEYFVNSFRENIESRNLFTTRQYAFSNMPRQFLELASIFLLGVIVFVSVSDKNIKFENLILTLTFFVVAFSRVLPAISRIITSYNFIQYSNAVIDKVYEQLKDYMPESSTKNTEYISEFNNQIKLVDVSFKYSNSNENIINKVNFDIDKNDIYGIVGSSGSGKTTLVNLILGLLKPTKGEIYIDNNKIIDSSVLKNIVEYVPQSSLILDDTLFNNILFGNDKNNFDFDWMKECINFAKLEELVKSLQNGIDTVLGEDGSKISGGQKQRIGLARALYSKPKIIVLDEATNALDKKTEKIILKTIKKLSSKITFIIISHEDQVLNICNKRYNL